MQNHSQIKAKQKDDILPTKPQKMDNITMGDMALEQAERSDHDQTAGDTK